MIKESEQWKPVTGYEGLYEVSSHGRIESIPRNGTKGGILKLGKDTRGYQYINIYKNNIRQSFRIHRLVSIHFIPNPKKLPQVNHIDGNKLNNYVGNLEWCTASENTQHAYDSGLQNSDHCIKKVYCLELNKKFESATEAGRQLNIHQQNISKCCIGLRKSAGKHPDNKKIKLTWKFL